MSPHILILPMYYPEAGAPLHRGYMFYEQAMQIARSGCRVGLAYTEQRQPKTFSWKIFRKESHFQVSQEDNGTFVTLRMHAWNMKLSTRMGGIIWSLLTLLLVRNYIRRFGKPDKIHAHFGLWAGYAASLIYKCYGIPYIVTEHASSIGCKKVTPSQMNTLKKAYEHALSVVCVSSQLKASLQALHLAKPEKIIVVPNFVDISTFHLNKQRSDKKKKFTWVSVGNLVELKGFEELIEAFGRSFANLPHVSLIIAGSGEREEILRNKIKTLHLEQQITLAGHLARTEVAQLLHDSNAFVLASHIETFGIVFIEAMATGMPVVGTLCGGPSDIVTPECGYLTQPKDIDGLAVAMRQLYERYEQFDGEDIRASVVQRFDFELAGQKLKEIYQS